MHAIFYLGDHDSMTEVFLMMGERTLIFFNKDGHKIVFVPMESMLDLSPKEDSSVLLSKGELENEVKRRCDILQLVVVEDNVEVYEVPSIMRLVLEEFYNVF